MVCIFGISSSFASNKRWLQDVNIKNSFDDRKLELSALEKRIAKNFHQLFKVAKHREINSKVLTQLKKDLQKSKTFYHYIVWPNTLLKIQKLKATNQIQTYCSELSQTQKSNYVLAYLQNNLVEHCYKKYLQSLSKASNKKLSFHQNFQDHFYKNLNLFERRPLLIELEYLISRFKKESDLNQHYSKLISDYYINARKSPPKQLLKYIKITPKFTKFIQTIGIDKRSTENVFYREFYNLYKETLDLADKKVKRKEVEKSYNTALNFFISTFVHQPKEKSLDSMLSFGKSLTRRSYFKLARKTFAEIIAKQETSINDTVFEYMWTHIAEGDFDDALKVVEKYEKRINNISLDSRLSFWTGYSHLREGSDTKAQKLFKNLIQKNPLSYYSILSAKILSENSDKKDTKKTYFDLLNKKRALASQNALEFDHRWLKRVLAWSEVSNSSLLRLELKSILGTMDESSIQTHLVSAAYKLSKSNNYLDSFKVIYRFVDQGIIAVNEDVLKILFPTPYYNELRSKTKDFDPVIALSLIRQESGFNRYARSHVGARGLMQLMPGTARRFKRRVSTRQLYNPNTNIQIGTTYFSKLMDLFNNNLVYSLAAYNAGENRVKDWKNRNYVDNSESMLENIENIPFYETRKYVKLIFRNIFFYKMLTEGSENQDSHKLNKIYDIHLGFKQ